MTPHIQFEPSRRQQRLKHIHHSSEAERKKLFAIGRLLDIQEERQPRPFLNTALGKLPPELRVLIYQHLLVIPRFQTDTDHNTKNAKGSSIASQPFVHLKKSSLSILRTCRQIKHEAHRILADSIPYFANARELLSYLTGVGSTGRLRLTALRVRDLVCSESSIGPVVPYIREQSGIYYLNSRGGISCRYGAKDPDVMGAFSLLKECKSLRMIYIDMKQGEEPMHFTMLQTFIDGVYTQLYNPGFHHWAYVDGVFTKIFTPGLLHDWFVSQLTKPTFYSRTSEYICPFTMYSTLVSSGQPMGRDVLVKIHMNLLSGPKLFSVTRLGMLPQKLRTQIYHELVAAPPIHVRQMKVTQDIYAGPRSYFGPLESSTTPVHLQASYFAVLRVCRLIYFEAHPIFYGRGSYYTDNAKEFQQLVRLSVRTFLQQPLNLNLITSLSLKDIVSWSDKKGYCLDYATLISVFQLEKWRGLRKIWFCMRVGEEMGILEFLFLLPRISRGVVDFLDDSKWVIRQQHSEEEWQLQYACFETNALLYKRGKNGEELSDKDIAIQRRILRAQSLALELHDGSQRYVEVQIGGRFDWVMRCEMQILSARFSSLSLGQ